MKDGMKNGGHAVCKGLMAACALLSATAMMGDDGASAKETRNLLATIIKDSKGSYPTSWAAQASFWEGGEPVSGCEYVVPKGVTLRVPQTTTAGEHPFPGDKLTIINSTIAYSGCRTPAIITFSDLVFQTTGSSFAYWANYTGQSYFRSKTSGWTLFGDYSTTDGKITIDGSVKVTCDSNLGSGTLWRGTLIGGDSAVIQVKGVTAPITYWGQTHHFRLESNTDQYSGKLSVFEKANVTTRGLANGTITVGVDGILQPLDCAADSLTTKNLTLEAGSLIAIPVDGSTGANGSIKVTGTFAKAAGEPTIVMLTNSVVTTTTFTPPTKLKILTVPSSATLTEDQFVYYGVETDYNEFKVKNTPVTTGKFTVETDEDAGTKTLYLNLKRKVNNLVSQSGTTYWNLASNWSDGKTPDADGDYYMNGLGFRMSGKDGETFTGNSLTMNPGASGSTSFGIQVRTIGESNFPNEGLILNAGNLFQYCGAGTLKSRSFSKINGNILVTSCETKPVRFNPANNPYRGFTFTEGHTFSGWTNAWVVMMGSYCCDNDRRSFMHNEFACDTSGYAGTFDVRTNAVVALGDSGLPQGSVKVDGGTYKTAAGAVSTLSAATSTTISNLTMAADAAIEVKVDETTGESGKIRVSGKYVQDGMVQVFLTDYPNRYRGDDTDPDWNYEVLTVAAGAGEVNADNFEFGGVISGKTRLFGSGSFSVVTDETTGDKTVVYSTIPNGGLKVIVR